MRAVWLVIAFFAFIALVVLMFFENVPAIFHNLFYKSKRRVCWNPMDFGNSALDLDETENFYHK